MRVFSLEIAIGALLFATSCGDATGGPVDSGVDVGINDSQAVAADSHSGLGDAGSDSQGSGDAAAGCGDAGVCGAEFVCVDNSCLPLGPECGPLKPCSDPTQFCDPVTDRCTPGAKKCEFVPPVGQFAPKEKWTWEGSPVAPEYDQVMMTPMVANLTDDNGDGKIDANDIPDVVFIAFKKTKRINHPKAPIYAEEGRLRVISGDGSGEHFSIGFDKVLNGDGTERCFPDENGVERCTSPEMMHTHPSLQVAIGNIDSDPEPEIVACLWRESLLVDGDGNLRPKAQAGLNGGVIAFEHNGKLKWRNPKARCWAPSIANVDGTGPAEVVSCYGVLDGETGETVIVDETGTDPARTPPLARWQYQGSTVGCAYTVAVDLDEDGQMEVVGPNRVYTHEGKLEPGWENNVGRFGRWMAVADLDNDGEPEVVGMGNRPELDDAITLQLPDLNDPNTLVDVPAYGDRAHWLWAYNADGSVLWGPVDINVDAEGKSQADPREWAGYDLAKGGGPIYGGGPPTVGDFDKDGRPEVAMAGGWGYVIFEGESGKPKWFRKTQDLSSRATGSSVFDFEGDGKAEAVYNDELVTLVYRGDDGDPLYERCNTSGTLLEYPVIVDVDNDGHAEIVVASNDYAGSLLCEDGTSQTGIRVFTDAQNRWVPTRRIWNQHAYHVTNVNEDGSIPRVQERNWENSTLNNFRQNVQPGGLFDAPDLTGGGTAECTGNVEVEFKVVNRGAKRIIAGMDVTLYMELPGGTLKKLQTLKTTKPLRPGQSEVLKFSAAAPTEALDAELPVVVIVDDDGDGNSQHNECEEGNNRVEVAKFRCGVE